VHGASEEQQQKKPLKVSLMEFNEDDDSRVMNLSDEFSTTSPNFKTPKFISDVPVSSDKSLFDIFYNMDMNTWSKFNVDKELNNTIVAYHHMP